MTAYSVPDLIQVSQGTGPDTGTGEPGFNTIAKINTALLLAMMWSEYDQRRFENWCRNAPGGGIALDGDTNKTDDTAAFLYGINQLAADGKKHWIRGWPGKFMYCNSVVAGMASPYFSQATGNGSGTGSIVKLGPMLTIPSNISFDGRGMAFVYGPNAVASLASCGVLLTSNPNTPAGTTGDQGLSYGFSGMGIFNTVHMNDHLAQADFAAGTLVIDSKVQSGGCQYLTIAWNTFNQSGKNHIVSYNNAALNTYFANQFIETSLGTAGGTGSTGAGAGIYFAAGSLGSGNNEANNTISNKFSGGGVGMVTEAPEVISQGDHFDYQRLFYQVRQPGSLSGSPSGTPGGNVNFTHRMSFAQPHLEFNQFQSHYDAANSAYGDSGASQYLAVTVFDPFIYANPSNNPGQQLLAYVFSSGTGSAAAPYGTYIDGPGGCIVFNPNVIGMPGSVPGGGIKLYREGSDGANGRMVVGRTVEI